MDKAERDPELPVDNLTIRPEAGELGVLQELAERLRWATDVALKFDDEESVEVPESLKEGMRRLTSFLATDASVEIQSYEEIVTTQQAASLLGISRPHLIHLIEKENVMPYQPGERPGRHRRLRLRDVLAYKTRRASRAIESISDEFDIARHGQVSAKG